ncbi:unnamed protein product [Eruca vesicaria subsp. sativa]|uniref:Uncharacterized protein n=1 Tax=Eruca vesicaria subsp. sativa TaxID=29727 RepID=A0ABC8KG43_ERUVS|nr:unnamed protein product [Eruca vesicaria subsp. sativa]
MSQIGYLKDLVRFKFEDSSLSIVESNHDDHQLAKADNKMKVDKWNEYEDKTIVEMLKSTQGSQMTEGEESSSLFNTPSSKRSQDERDDVPELTSTSKKVCLKTIKIETISEEEIKNDRFEEEI